MESINQRSKNYYNLTCIEEDTVQSSGLGQKSSSAKSDESRNNSKNNDKLRIMFENVTPKISMNETGQKDFIFSIGMKTENGGIATIYRTYQHFLDLHLSWSSDFPDDVPSNFNIPNKLDFPDTTATRVVELSYSLHKLLKKITKVDKMLFSDVFHAFLFQTEDMKIESGQEKNIKSLELESFSEKPPVMFEIVSAKNVCEDDKKFTLYTIMMKKHLMDKHPAFIKRRYSDFYNLYGILNSKYNSKVFNNFKFPKKYLTSKLNPEQIAERAKGFESYLNLISSSELVNSRMFEEFLTLKEYKLSVSHINTKLFGDAAILLENIFHIKEKLLTISNISVFDCLVDLTACLVEFETYETAFQFVLLAVQSMRTLQGHQVVENMKVPILRTALSLAQKIGENGQPFADELDSQSYVAYPQSVGTLMDIVREGGRYQVGRYCNT